MRRTARHGRSAPLRAITLRGLDALDMRTAGAKALRAERERLIAALGGEAALSPQKRRLVSLAARASAIVDHLDGWILAQSSLVNARTRTAVPVLASRQAVAEHLARILEKLGLDAVQPKPLTLAEIRAEASR